MHDARVEVDVGVELAADEVFVFQSDFFQSLGQLEQRIILEAEFFQDFVASFLHQLGAWVVVFVNAVTKAHELDARVFIFDLLHELAHFRDAAHGLNVFQHVQASFVGAAVCRAPQASHTRRNGCEGVGA